MVVNFINLSSEYGTAFSKNVYRINPLRLLIHLEICAECQKEITDPKKGFHIRGKNPRAIHKACFDGFGKDYLSKVTSNVNVAENLTDAYGILS